MHQNPGWLAASLLLLLTAIAPNIAHADEADTSDASAYVLQAEMALQREDYFMAVQEYRKAAELSDDAALARQAALVGMTYGFDREALVAAKRWQKLDSKSNEARAVLAQISFRLGDVKTARRHFNHLLEKSKEPPGEKLLLLVSYLSDGGDPKKADKLMRSLARPYPDSALAHYAVATVALRAGDTDHALERVRKSIDLNPDGLRAKLLFARVLLAQGEPQKAIDYVARIIGDDPDPDPDARMELAVLYMMVNREDDALSQVNQVLLEQSGRLDALRMAAIISFHQGSLDAAWDDFQDLLASGQYRMDALYYLGRISDYRGEKERAIRFYSEVTSGSNAMSSQRRAAGLRYYENEDLNGALEQLDKFKQQSPGDWFEVQLAKAQLLSLAEENDDALKLYDKALRDRPDSERAALSRAELLLTMDRLDDAVAAYAEAARRFPKSAMSLNAYGYTLADRTNRYTEAEKLIRKALRYDPDSPAIIDSLGWVLFKLGRHDEALVELERAYKGMQDHEVAAHIVETLDALGRRDEALEFLREAELKTPDSHLLEDVRQRLFPDEP
ncbi:MAG: tetratricopeptide repeat protein [Woeseiaceae bacterium]|nr:tetratricopeptide repeat protein [Woeseiaceae bacterium]